MSKNDQHPSSFRDPNGFLFYRDETLFRQINHPYKENYQTLNESGLYALLVKKGWIIKHSDSDAEAFHPESAYKIIQPEPIPFISYPYEWSFSQLKDAALLTLKIQKAALKYSMSLKDSSAYNIQFNLNTGKPVLIDTLSFEKYQEGLPWVAYRQFCQHFLGPLALMAHTDIRLNQLSKVYIDGPPLSLVSKLLPFKTRKNFGLLSHIHLHSKAQDRYAESNQKQNAQTIGKNNLLALIDNLERTTNKLTWKPTGTEWGRYYQDTNYTPAGLQHKQILVKEFISLFSPKYVWDFGANTGLFSRIAADSEALTVAFDIDPAAVEINYLQSRAKNDQNLLPLLLDLTNPSPAIGWDNLERDSLFARPKPDLILALALIHHLAISNNLPLEMIAASFSRLAPWLVIEFVPKEDTQVQRLLSTREDIFPNYTQAGFEDAFQKHYHIQTVADIKNSSRRLYLFRRRENF